MIKPIVKDPIFLSQKSAPATVLDLPTAQDLRDTLLILTSIARDSLLLLYTHMGNSCPGIL